MIVQALTDKQRAAILLSRGRKVTVYEGAVRSAKTITSLLDWIALVRTAPPGRLAIIGKTERTLRNNIIGPLQDMLGKRRISYNRGLGEITMFGRTILVVGANDERASDKIRGVTLAGAYVDEATILPESFWSMLLTRLSVPGSRLLATTNPDSPANWLKVSYLDRAADHLTGTGSQVEHFPVGWSSSYDIVRNGEPTTDDPDAPLDLCRLSFVLDDNPTLDPDYRAFVRSTYTGLWFKRFILGLWVAAEGAIYDMLDEALHLAPAPLEVGAAWLGIDYGTSNATHAVLLGTDWTNQRLHAIAEWRHDGRAQGSLTDAQLSQRLAEWVAGLKLDHEGITPVLDPSAASLRVQMRNDGWSGLSPANNAVLDGIRAVSTLFAQGRLVIDQDRCPWLWKELQGYTWDERAQNAGEDKPNKVNDHGCLIAGTQVLTERGPLPIELVRPGDRVQTRDGLRPVLAAGMTDPDAELWRLETVDGRTLVGTGDHPVWVDGEGWKRLDAVGGTDKIGAVGSALVAVRSVTRLDSRAAVYNLTVSGSPEFYANGLLVHNCDSLRYSVMAAYPVWRNWTGSPLSLVTAA